MSLFKEPFNDVINKQLKDRENLIGKNEYTSQDITYLNSKTAWISLKSSVDAIPTSNSPTNSTVDSTLAKNNVLLGGLYDINGPKTQPLYSTKTTNGASHLLGFKPKPGITNISIKNKGAYGSLRQATVNFQCWDVKQLEELELLYMRPGFTVLLEWGWLPYIDRNEKLSSILYEDTKFFDRKDVDLQEYFKELKSFVIESAGNYDFMFGYVMNYSWKLRDDGGYDCLTEIISTGEILESYKINFAAPEIRSQSINNNGTIFPDTALSLTDIISYEEIRRSYDQNIIRGLCFEIFERAVILQQKNKNQLEYQHGVKKYIIDFISLDFETGEKVISTDDPNTKDKIPDSISGNKNIYITLRSFVDLMNNYVLLQNSKNPKNPNVISLSVDDRIILPQRNGEPLQCLCHPLQISLDPRVCLIKNTNFLRTILKNPPLPEVIPYNIIAPTQDHERIATAIKQGIDAGAPTNVIEDFLRENIKDLNTLLSVDKAFSTKYKDISLYKILYQRFKDDEINLLFPYKYPPLYEIIDTQSNRAGFINTIFNVKDPKANQFLSLDEETRKQYIKNAENEINKNNIESYKENIQDINKFFGKLDSNEGILDFVDENSKNGVIGNIYINLKYIYLLAAQPSLEEQDPAEKNNIDLTGFLRTMLRDIQSSTGNVNNFEIFNEENIGYIIDLNSLMSIDKNQKLPFEFQIGKNNSIVRNINLESQIFSNQSTIIAISAQSDPGKLGLENSSMIAYNTGITDRMISKKNTYSNNTEKQNNGFGILINNLSSFFKNITSTSYLYGFIGDNPFLKVESVESYKNALKEIIVFFTTQYKSTNTYKDILPTKVSLTIDGIGGIIIGNIFNIDKDSFPSSYVGEDEKNPKQGVKLYYTVTGINHDIDKDGQWVTIIEGNPFIPDSSSNRVEDLVINNNSINYNVASPSKNYIYNENLNPPPSNIAEDSRRMCIAINTIFGSIDFGLLSFCARYTYSIAKNFKDAKTTSIEKLKGPVLGPEKGVSGDAGSTEYTNNLIKLGYKIIAAENNLSKADLKSRLESSVFKIGDIVLYRSVTPTGVNRGNNAHLYGHTQIYTGGISYDATIKSNIPDSKQERWAAYDKQNPNFVYNHVKSNTWSYTLFRL
jgi:hypothetical protein